MKSMPAWSARRASARQSGQLADQRSGTVVAVRLGEQLAPNSPIFRALPLYMAMRSFMDGVGASTAFLLRYASRDNHTGIPRPREARSPESISAVFEDW